MSRCATTQVSVNSQIRVIIVNRGDWLGSPANIKGANKGAKIDVGRSATLHNLVFSSYTMHDYVTNTFLLVSSSISGKQLLCFGQGLKREQKHTTKNFVEFHNHFTLLTMGLAYVSTGRRMDSHATTKVFLYRRATKFSKEIG